mmetsp:Transcript_40510/g.29855  ORF Transcript_40510/g.29855 Transcript_40510/m.29855 type:complete len:142 (+) Transcript_40510:731-1156(+)
MSVLPKQSDHALPPIYRHLQSSPDSEIIDFYPEDFTLDINGAAYTWMGVNLLPFIEMDRLLEAMRRVEAAAGPAGLSQAERDRNRHGVAYLYTRVDGENTKSGLVNILIQNNFDNENLEIEASYKRYDMIAGNGRGLKQAS